MPKPTQKSVHKSTTLPPENSEVLDSQEESVSSDQEQDEEVSFHPSLAYSAYPVSQVISSMYMPYIEGPRIDWTVNDGHYHTFLKVRLKHENMLECGACCLSRETTVQESNSMQWGLWDGPICFMEPA